MLRGSLTGSFKRFFRVFPAALVLFGWGCAAKPVPLATFEQWNTFLKDWQRTNISTDSMHLPPGSVWRDDISPYFEFIKIYPPEQLSSPVISRGVVYVGSTDRGLYAFDLRKGKKLWRFDASYVVESTPTVAMGMVCFGTGDGVLYCLDELTGEKLFSFQARSEILSSPVIKEGVVYFASSDSRIYALSAFTGRKLWSYYRTTVSTVLPRIYSSIAVENGRLYHLFSDGVLVCLDLATGRELWTRELIKDFIKAVPARRTPAVKDGNVYAIDEGGAILSLDSSTGEVRAVFSSLKAVDFAVLDGMIIAAGKDRVSALGMDDGSVIWERDIELGPATSVFVAGEHLFILSNFESKLLGIKYLSQTDGYIQALSLATGRTVWTEKLSSTISSHGASSEDHLALFTNKGIIEVFGAR